MRRIPPGPHTIRGIDVSKWQRKIDWAKVAEAGFKFAFIRVSFGASKIDAWFERNWEEAHKHGLICGAYQFFLSGDGAAEQVGVMLKALEKMGGLQSVDLPPVLDLEQESVCGKYGSALARVAVEWTDVVHACFKRRPIVYTNKAMFVEHPALQMQKEFAALPLWISHWDVSAPIVPDPWDAWSFWQTTNKLRVPGIEGYVDGDLFNGTEEQLVLFAARSKTEPPPPPSEPEPDSEPASEGGFVIKRSPIIEKPAPPPTFLARLGGWIRGLAERVWRLLT